MKIITNNKKAFHNFFISDLFEAGIALEGSEVKSIRDGGVSLNESFVVLKNGEAFLKNAYIKPYDKANSFQPDSHRTRKLLLHKDEILKLERKVKEKGFSVMPTKVYLSGGRVKIEIGLAKGRKLYDKREVLKNESIKRDIERARRDLK